MATDGSVPSWRKSWEYGGVKGWKRAVKELNFDSDAFLYRQRDLDEILPWAVLDTGIERRVFRGKN